MLSSNFVENTLTNIDAGFPANKPSFIRDYDYDDDSDLESVSENDFEDDKPCNIVESTEGPQVVIPQAELSNYWD